MTTGAMPKRAQSHTGTHTDKQLEPTDRQLSTTEQRDVRRRDHEREEERDVLEHVLVCALDAVERLGVLVALLGVHLRVCECVRTEERGERRERIDTIALSVSRLGVLVCEVPLLPLLLRSQRSRTCGYAMPYFLRAAPTFMLAQTFTNAVPTTRSGM